MKTYQMAMWAIQAKTHFTDKKVLSSSTRGLVQVFSWSVAMGGGMSIVAVEAGSEGGPHDRRCILEAISPLQLASTLTMGDRLGNRGPSFMSFGPAGFTSSRMSGAGPFGSSYGSSSLALTGRETDEPPPPTANPPPRTANSPPRTEFIPLDRESTPSERDSSRP